MAEDKFPDWIKAGLQKRLKQAHSAEIFDVEGPERKRSSAAGYTTLVSAILSPKLDLTVQERAIGNCYGAFYEQANAGGSSEFLREYVDGGGVAGSGYTERQAHIVNMVLKAQEALETRPLLRYTLGKARANTTMGRHQPIRALTLINYVCVLGWSSTTIGLTFDWCNTIGTKTKVPDRQRKAIAAEIKASLNTIGDAWAEVGMDVPSQFGTVEVE